MNKRQKEVVQTQLDSEKAVLKELEKQYKKALQDIERKIMILESDELTQSRIYRIEYQKALKKQVEAVLERLHADEYSIIQQFLSGSYTDGFLGTVYDMHGQGVPLIFPIDPKEAVAAVMTESKLSVPLYDALGIDTKKLSKTISSEISRGIASNMAYTDIARNIANASKAPLSRAKTIVQTESHRIQEKAALDAQYKAKSRGANVVKQWNSTLDGDTRPTHRKLDGQIREVEQHFEANGLEAMYPGGFGDPAEDCNCRCRSLTRARWALDEEELQTLKERAEFFELDKTEDFEDFKAKYLKAAERESQFGVVYGKDAVNVDFNYINSEEYKSKFAQLTADQDANTAIHKAAKDVLRHCDGTEHEDMYLFAMDGTTIAKVTDSVSSLGINYTEEFKEVLKDVAAHKTPVIAMHNHPHGAPPSPDDFRKAFENQYSFGIAIGHNGQVYVYSNNAVKLTQEMTDQMADEIGFLYRMGWDIDRASQMVYNEYGLKYTILEGDD